MPTHNLEHILCELRGSGTLLVDWGPRWDLSERFTCEPIEQMLSEESLGTQEELDTFLEEYRYRHKGGENTDFHRLAKQSYVFR